LTIVIAHVLESPLFAAAVLGRPWHVTISDGLARTIARKSAPFFRRMP
jgi:hypothetical protein